MTALPPEVVPKVPDTVEILQVDDDPQFLEVSSELLERQHDSFDVRTFTDPQVALEQLNDDTDCILSDYEMPNMDGVELLEEVRSIYPDLPYILFTGKGNEEIASKAISAGVTDYFQKRQGSSRYEILANRIENAVEQYNAQQALANSQQRLSLFFEQTPLGVIEWNKDFTVRRVNDAAVDILGYTEEELRGESWEKIVPESDRDDVQKIVSLILENRGGYQHTNQNLRSDGEEIICEWHNRVVTDDGEIIGVFSQFQDITDWKEDKRRLEALTDNIPGLVCQFYDRPGWPVELLRGSAEDVFGYTTEEILWKFSRLGTLIHPDDLSRVRKEVNEQLAKRGEYEVEYRIIHKNNDYRWIWDRGQYANIPAEEEPQILEGILIDITSRKQQERDLKETNTILSALLENLPVGILVENTEGEIINGNAAFCELHGVDVRLDEFIGVHREDVVEYLADKFTDPEAIRAENKELIQDQSTTKGDIVELNDGRMLERHCIPYEHPNGTANIWMLRDITEQINRQQELEEQNQQLEEFAHTVSHDLRNPLNVAEGRLEMVQQSDNAHIKEAKEAIDRSQNLIDDLLALAREKDTLQQMTTVSIENAAYESWQNVSTGSANLDVTSDRLIEANPQRLQQLFENLMRNATDHCGNSVTIQIGTTTDGFFISDDGPGVPPDQREKVFERGYTTSPEGTGYGLSIVQQIVNEHGWRISIEESKGGGARFLIRTNV